MTFSGILKKVVKTKEVTYYDWQCSNLLGLKINDVRRNVFLSWARELGSEASPSGTEPLSSIQPTWMEHLLYAVS